MGARKSVFSIVAVLSLGFAATGICGVFTVTGTGDSGPGTLRQAIQDANDHAGPDTIGFDISETGSLFNGMVWFIEPLTDLPPLSDNGTVIDGTTQEERRGDKNEAGPEIYVTGFQGRNGHPVSTGFTVHSALNVIRGLVVSGFMSQGILINGGGARDNRIERNYIGVNFTGLDTVDSPNAAGIVISSGAGHNTIGGHSTDGWNLVSGNRFHGILIASADSNLVEGNFIGTDRDGLRPLPNGQTGVNLFMAAANDIGGALEGEGNVISGNGRFGVEVADSQSVRNRIAGNWIGTDRNGNGALPNTLCGVFIHEGARQNQVGPENAIRFNGNWGGVYVYGEGSMGNTITRNSISGNAGMGIILHRGNGDLVPPVPVRTAGGIEGTAPPNALVELFSDASGQGGDYEGSATADGSGRFVWTGAPIGPFITATATDADGNTSPFSSKVSATGIPGGDAAVPQGFSLYQNFPNPFNPSTVIPFNLGYACRVRLVVTDIAGREVSVLVEGSRPAGRHEVRFDAGEIASGVYLVRLEAGEWAYSRKALFVR